ncbi:MAG: MFS transporter [Proteobacteria bacterium]|nr:MFS transporter [Pseudomonadota bacterium]
MIEINNLSKRYGLFKAINNVTFSVEKGGIVGFLGPNGAGKSTTMRILCGCIGATSGEVFIDGKEISEAPLELKKRIGYLPETPPLYPNMTVNDYLCFAAQIKGVPVEDSARSVIDRVGLSDVSDRIILHLSKGYKQRVGIAQALIHNPDILVLDEPSSGLDPAQRKEIRTLLSELAEGQRTVILSTHVLAEVEALCKRVVIISQGQIVAQDSISALQQKSQKISLQVARPSSDLEESLNSIDGVQQITNTENGRYNISINSDVREQIAKVAVPAGLLQLTPAASLEEIYLRLTNSSQPISQAQGETQ